MQRSQAEVLAVDYAKHFTLETVEENYILLLKMMLQDERDAVYERYW